MRLISMMVKIVLLSIICGRVTCEEQAARRRCRYARCWGRLHQGASEPVIASVR